MRKGFDQEKHLADEVMVERVMYGDRRGARQVEVQIAIRNLLEKGLSLQEVADRTGACTRTVSRASVAMGKESNCTRVGAPERKAEVLRLMRDEGYTHGRAARKVGTSIRTARAVALEHGLLGSTRITTAQRDWAHGTDRC